MIGAAKFLLHSAVSKARQKAFTNGWDRCLALVPASEVFGDSWLVENCLQGLGIEQPEVSAYDWGNIDSKADQKQITPKLSSQCMRTYSCLVIKAYCVLCFQARRNRVN